jgi:NTP pyrophosphatase (non-canonical NTP hydrolase)
MDVMQEVQAELARATAKFPTWPTDPLHALAVLGEEFGELTKAMLQFTYEPHKKVTRMHIRAEAIQTAAMALRLAQSLSLYDYAPAKQHRQSGYTSEGSQYVGKRLDELPDDYEV